MASSTAIPFGSRSIRQLVPPSAVRMMAGVAWPWSTPTAQQSETVGQEMALADPEAEPNAPGATCELQVFPPSVVETTTTPSAPVPTTEQSDAVGHEMPRRREVPGGRVCGDHVAPPSLVARTTASPKGPPALTAQQFDVVGQEMPARNRFVAGRFSACHVAPPFMVDLTSLVP
jgi:hypothetical protein